MQNIISKPEGKIKTILRLYSEGKTKQEIIADGFHKGTVSIQLAKYLKAKKNESSITS